MPAGPVIIDDGGSTRIRYLPEKGNGAMDSLLDVGRLPEGSPAPGMQGSQHTIAAAFANLTIVYINPDTAKPGEIPVAGGQYPPLAPGDKIVIVSGDLTFQVDIKVDSTVLTSFGSERSGLPLVTAKQQNQKRRYLIDAASTIDSVTFTPRGGSPITPFDATKMPSSYTQVHLSPDVPARAS